MTSTSCYSKIFIIAPLCDQKSSKWFSTGRHRKLSQLFDSLTSLNYNFNLFSTAPSRSGSYLGHSYVRCCSFDTLYLRYIQLFFSGIYFGFKFLFTGRNNINLWLYNSRFPEFIFLLPIKLLNYRKTNIFIQFEDLPFARKQNFGIRGLLDVLSTFVLSLIFSCCSVASKSMEQTLVSRYGFNSRSIIIFPPLADKLYLSVLSERHEPLLSNVVKVMYAGGYSEEKGIYNLLDAFYGLPAEKFSLNLYGPVPQSLSRSLSGIPNIVIHGLVDELHLFQSYVNSDVIVNPHKVISSDALIFPFKTIEILLSGSLPLLTPMPGLKQFKIPSDCFFDDSVSLYHKLLNSKQLYIQNKDSIKKLASHLRTFSDPSSFSNRLKGFLDTEYFTE